MNNKKSIVDKDFNYFPILLTLWREKFLILILCLLGLIFSYLIVQNKQIFHKAKISINSPPPNLFSSIKFGPLPKDVEIRFYQNLFSRDELSNFLGGEEKLSLFKIEELKTIPSETFSNVFEATFINNIDGLKLLSDYIFHIQLITINQEIEYIKTSINHRIDKQKIEFKIAKNLGIETPEKISLEEVLSLEKILKEPLKFGSIDSRSFSIYPTYNSGTIVLSKRIANLEQTLNQLNERDFIYDIILDAPYITGTLNNYKVATYIAGIILGFLLSLMIIFIKVLIKDLKKYS